MRGSQSKKDIMALVSDCNYHSSSSIRDKTTLKQVKGNFRIKDVVKVTAVFFSVSVIQPLIMSHDWLESLKAGQYDSSAYSPSI